MDGKAAAAGAGPAPAPESRHEVLHRREKELQQLQERAAVKEAAARVDTAAAKAQAKDLTELKRNSGEIDQAAAAYRAAYPKLDQRRKDLDGYRVAKRTRIEAAVGADKPKLEAAVTWLGEEIGKRTEKLEEREAAVAAAKSAKETADRKLTEERQKYDTAKGRQKSVEAVLTGLDTLRKQVDKAEDDLDGADTDADRKAAAWRAYVTLSELNGRFDDDLVAALVDDQTNVSRLEEAWRDWSATQETVQDAEVTLQSEQAACDLAKASLAELTGDRIGAVLNHLN